MEKPIPSPEASIPTASLGIPRQGSTNQAEGRIRDHAGIKEGVRDVNGAARDRHTEGRDPGHRSRLGHGALFRKFFYNPEGNGAPKGISIFFAVPAPFAGNTSAMSKAELELRLKGKDLITPAHIQALTKSQVQIPNDGYVIRSTLENQLCLLDYIFGKTSHMYIQLEKLLAATKNQQYKRTFDEMTMKKPAFVASFLQAIDTKAQLFLGSCASASSVDQVNFGILDFDDEVNKIMLRQPFSTQLPQIVQQMVTTLEGR